jgi:hypothetical protein
MDSNYKVIQDTDGRWVWVTLVHDHKPLAISSSPISFPDEDSAKADWVQHYEASRDKNGKTIRAKTDLQRLISTAAAACEDCRDAVFAEIHWHAPDEMGCNWNTNSLRGSDWFGCVDCINPAMIQLRNAYNIPDEG